MHKKILSITKLNNWIGQLRRDLIALLDLADIGIGIPLHILWSALYDNIQDIMENGKKQFLDRTIQIFSNPINIDEKIIYNLPDLNKLIKYTPSIELQNALGSIETIGKVPNFDIDKNKGERECPDKCYFKKESGRSKCYRYDSPNYINDSKKPQNFDLIYCALIDKQKIYNEI